MKIRRLLKGLGKGEKGFTLIELLIVVAILGILAAVIIPNAAGFMLTGRLNAANTEVANVKTAATGYMAEYGVWPPDSSTSAVTLLPYLSSAPATFYSFAPLTGLIDGAGATDLAADGVAPYVDATNWPGLTFDAAVGQQKWIRTP